MNRLFRSTAFFVFLALALSALTGCGNDQPIADQGANSPKAPANTAANADPAKKKSEYPPVAAAVAQSDLKNLDGSTFKVADKTGKVLLLNMWATWCGPCRAEMPSLVKMQDEHRDAGLEVIGLNTDDETVAEINEFASDMKLNYTLVWADTKLQQALLNISKFNGIPQSFIIDREGNLRGVFRGANPADIKKMEELITLVVNES